MTKEMKRYGVVRAARDYPGIISQSESPIEKVFLVLAFWIYIPVIGLFGTRWTDGSQ